MIDFSQNLSQRILRPYRIWTFSAFIIRHHYSTKIVLSKKTPFGKTQQQQQNFNLLINKLQTFHPYYYYYYDKKYKYLIIIYKTKLTYLSLIPNKTKKNI